MTRVAVFAGSLGLVASLALRSQSACRLLGSKDDGSRPAVSSPSQIYAHGILATGQQLVPESGAVNSLYSDFGPTWFSVPQSLRTSPSETATVQSSVSLLRHSFFESFLSCLLGPASAPQQNSSMAHARVRTVAWRSLFRALSFLLEYIAKLFETCDGYGLSCSFTS